MTVRALQFKLYYMKILKLYSKTHGFKEVLLDDEDYYIVSDYQWSIIHESTSNTFYAKRGQNTGNGKWIVVSMHRFIMGLSYGDKTVVDHINLNGLDNRKCNLRKCTNTDNSKNRRAWSNGSSKYLGVHFNINAGKYRAAIKINKKYIHLGTFPNTPCGELLAALKYDEKAIELHKEFANLNFKPLR